MNFADWKNNNMSKPSYSEATIGNEERYAKRIGASIADDIRKGRVDKNYTLESNHSNTDCERYGDMVKKAVSNYITDFTVEYRRNSISGDTCFAIIKPE